MKKASIAVKLTLLFAITQLIVAIPRARSFSQYSPDSSLAQKNQEAPVIRQSCDETQPTQRYQYAVQLVDTITALLLTLVWMSGELINHSDSDFSFRSLQIGCLLRPVWFCIVMLGLVSLVVDIVLAATLEVRIEATQPVAIAALLAFVLRNWMAHAAQAEIERVKMASLLRTKKVRYGIIEGPLGHCNYVIDPQVARTTNNTWHTERIFEQQQILGGKNQNRVSLRTKQVWTQVREMNCSVRLIRATLWADWLPTRAIEEIEWKQVLEIPRVHGALKSSIGLSVLKGVGISISPDWLSMEFWERDGRLVAALWAAECHESVERVWNKALELIPVDGSAIPEADVFVLRVQALMLNRTYRDWGD